MLIIISESLLRCSPSDPRRQTYGEVLPLVENSTRSVFCFVYKCSGARWRGAVNLLKANTRYAWNIFMTLFISIAFRQWNSIQIRESVGTKWHENQRKSFFILSKQFQIAILMCYQQKKKKKKKKCWYRMNSVPEGLLGHFIQKFEVKFCKNLQYQIQKLRI